MGILYRRRRPAGDRDEYQLRYDDVLSYQLCGCQRRSIPAENLREQQTWSAGMVTVAEFYFGNGDDHRRFQSG